MLIQNATVCRAVNAVSINKDLSCLQEHITALSLFPLA